MNLPLLKKWSEAPGYLFPSHTPLMVSTSLKFDVSHSHAFLSTFPALVCLTKWHTGLLCMFKNFIYIE